METINLERVRDGDSLKKRGNTCLRNITLGTNPLSN